MLSHIRQAQDRLREGSESFVIPDQACAELDSVILHDIKTEILHFVQNDDLAVCCIGVLIGNTVILSETKDLNYLASTMPEFIIQPSCELWH